MGGLAGTLIIFNTLIAGGVVNPVLTLSSLMHRMISSPGTAYRMASERLHSCLKQAFAQAAQ